MSPMKVRSLAVPVPADGARPLSARSRIRSKEKVSGCEKQADGGFRRAEYSAQISVQISVRALIPLRWGRFVLHAAITERGLLALQSPSESKDVFVSRLGGRARLEIGKMDGEQRWHSQFKAYWSALLIGADPGECPPLDLRGSEFQREVWKAICGIPRGTTLSYRELATAVGHAGAVRAAAAANRCAPAPGFIPTHRVVGADGQMLAPPGDPWSRLRSLWAQGERSGAARSTGTQGSSKPFRAEAQ